MANVARYLGRNRRIPTAKPPYTYINFDIALDDIGDCTISAYYDLDYCVQSVIVATPDDGSKHAEDFSQLIENTLFVRAQNEVDIIRDGE